jgi:hypothetical protein
MMYVLDVETVGIANAADYVGPIEAPANYKSADAIAKYVAEETPKRLAKAALDLDLAEIVAVGLLPLGVRPDELTLVPVLPSVMIRGEAGHTEAQMLAAVDAALAMPADLAATRPQFITFNGRNYDLPLIVRRRMYLGLTNGPAINLDRYRSEHIDLYERLTNYGSTGGHKLSWYAKRFGWTETSPIDGAGVAQAVAEGRWTDIRQHCAIDLLWTARLAYKMGVVGA